MQGLNSRRPHLRNIRPRHSSSTCTMPQAQHSSEGTGLQTQAQVALPLTPGLRDADLALLGRAEDGRLGAQLSQADIRPRAPGNAIMQEGTRGMQTRKHPCVSSPLSHTDGTAAAVPCWWERGSRMDLAFCFVLFLCLRCPILLAVPVQGSSPRKGHTIAWLLRTCTQDASGLLR